VFKVNVTARNPKREEQATPAIEALVDRGSELTWLPRELLERIGITPRRKRTFSTASKQILERPVGYAILQAEGHETTDEVVFAEPATWSCLGSEPWKASESWWTTSATALSRRPPSSPDEEADAKRRPTPIGT